MPQTPDVADVQSRLSALALDLRWTWSHEADALWQRLDPEAWEKTSNPWLILQETGPARLRELAADRAFTDELERITETRAAYQQTQGWFASLQNESALSGVAYFSMEFALGEALPLYAGGLGVLAGDFLKTASDLDIPVIGIGLFYGQGYFRQALDRDGWQHELFPVNDPSTVPIQPVKNRDGTNLRVSLKLPGRTLTLRVWRAQVGRVPLYLLDSNHPLNSPADRGITARLYEPGPEIRLLQELVLGIAGWRVVEAVAPGTEICHLNEGHAAFAVVERACAVQRRSGGSFWEALRTTRAGNVFTTHTPVEAGFDRFPPALMHLYAGELEKLADAAGVGVADLLGLGRANPSDQNEPFNMAYLAMRGTGRTIAVSRRHEGVSRRIFAPLYPRWPEHEVPVAHITNGVHVPTWDSQAADRLWTAACGKERWRCGTEDLSAQAANLTDEELWAMRSAGRDALVRSARRRLARDVAARGERSERVSDATQALDPNILCLGFARRFTAYKRPNLLLHDQQRLYRLLTARARPVQLIVAGKAHPADEPGKEMIREWMTLARQAGWRAHLVFLEDYDLAVAQELVQGVDVWINTPLRPWEACGTSGMKVLVNGGLNLSVMDGWWDEAFEPDLGWAIGDGSMSPDERDDRDAASLYELLEKQIVPEFYDRDERGLSRRWLARIRASLSRLTVTYSSNRMLQQHVEQLYLPAAIELHRRLDVPGMAADIEAWATRLKRSWPQLHIGHPTVSDGDGGSQITAAIYLGDIEPGDVTPELYADPPGDEEPIRVPMQRGAPVTGSINGFLYTAMVPQDRAADDFTVRVVPARDGVTVPTELPLIAWQR